MMSPRAVYIPISQKFITPEMYQQVPSEATSFTGSWHKAVLSALSDLGVSMSAYPGDAGQYDVFLATEDDPSQLAVILPVGTYAFAYGRTLSSFSDSDKASYIKDYQSSQKRYYYHFSYKGLDFCVNLGFSTSGTVGFAVMVNGSGSYSSFTPASRDDRGVMSSFVGSLIEAVISSVEAGGIQSLERNYTANSIKDFVARFSKSVKSSASTTPALTRYDIQSLLSDASPSRVWYSLPQRFAVYQCRFGSRLVTFGRSASGWHVSTLRQCWVVKSDGKLLSSRRASFYEESLSATSACQTAVMLRSSGRSLFLPLE